MLESANKLSTKDSLASSLKERKYDYPTLLDSDETYRTRAASKIELKFSDHCPVDFFSCCSTAFTLVSSEKSWEDDRRNSGIESMRAIQN